MNLTLERIKTNSLYTHSRLFERHTRNYFTLDVIEPPLPGFAAPNAPAALEPGEYKLFLKPHRDMRDMAPTFQRVKRLPRSGILQVEEPMKVVDMSFVSPFNLFKIPLWCGKLIEHGQILKPDKESFRLFMMRLVIAKFQRDVVSVYID